jgi:type IV secretory pathway TraG/TraD family ATPase VirD4
MNFDEFARIVDVRVGLKRPADAQHVSSFRTLLMYTQWLSEGALLLGAGAGSVALLYLSCRWLGLTNLLWSAGLAAIGLAIMSIAFAEATYFQFLLLRLNQREAHGSARWATTEDIRQARLLRRRSPTHVPHAVKLAEFGWKYDVAFPIDLMCCHVACFGPPQSGKSVSFFVPVIRQWSQIGSVFCLDTKGELFKYTGRSFRYVYRLDLENPKMSDRLNLLGACRRNAEFAGELASTIVGLDEKARHAKDPFWPQAETALLKALLMYLALVVDRADIAMARSLLAHQTVEQLGWLFEECGDPDVLESWGIFQKAKPELQGSIMIGLSTALEPFASPNARALFTPPTDDERAAGVAELDLSRLREKGVGAYLVVAEGTAERLHMVLSTIFGTVSAVLRRSGTGADPTPCLVAIDEAGNFTIPHLAARVGVGRSLGTAYFLGYQGISQPYSRMGHDAADATFDSIGTMIFLPGLGQKTAEYASRRLGKTTTWSLTSVDAVGKTLDSERLQETGRDLMDPSEIRRMLKHVEAVMVTGSVPPIHCAIPKPRLEGDIAYAEAYPIKDPTKPYESVVIDAFPEKLPVKSLEVVRPELELEERRPKRRRRRVEKSSTPDAAAALFENE